MTYEEAKKKAQAAADEYGFDYGVEKLGDAYHTLMLPAVGYRFGHELHCEVVSCTILSKCRPGHGPMARFRPVPGKFVVDLVQNIFVKVTRYGTDASGEYVEVQRAGSYGARVRLPLTCIRAMTDAERREHAESGGEMWWR